MMKTSIRGLLLSGVLLFGASAADAACTNTAITTGTSAGVLFGGTSGHYFPSWQLYDIGSGLCATINADGGINIHVANFPTTQGVSASAGGISDLAHGQATMANSVPVAIASDQSAVAVKAASGAFASGSIASGALAAGSIASGAAVSGAFAAGAISDLAHGQGTMAASVPVAIASDQGAVAVKAASAAFASGSIASGALASGSIASGAAVSGAFVAGAIADLAHGQAAMAASVPVVIANNQSAVPTSVASGGIASGAIASGAIASGALAAGSISSGAAVSGAFAAGAIADLAHGQAAMAASVPVVIANNQSNVPANIAQVGGSSLALGSTTASASVPVVIASNQTAADPCMFQAKTNTAFSSASGTFAIGPAGASSKKIYVCSIILWAPSAVSVSLAEGSSSTCGTSNQAAVIGVATNGTAANGMAIPANGAFTLGNGSGTVAATATNADYLCVFQSGTAQLAGNVTTVQQ